MNNPILKKATEIALKSGEILRSYWGKLKHIEKKQYYWDLVTEADLASEAYILQELKKHFPDHQILAEESGLLRGHSAEHQWFVDPLDGTTNFTHQYPMVSVSIGLLINGVPSIGVVYNPILNELFEAAIGQGATLNGEKISVSSVDLIEKSLLATGFAYDRKNTPDNNFKEFFHLTQQSQGVRRGGSAALDLAYVAAGRLDGFWERGLQPWDMAAGALLVTEAHGLVTSYEGNALDLSSGRILAANPLIHPHLIRELQAATS
jgi:myo-inositol-1(or 4)-monophosphatase